MANFPVFPRNPLAAANNNNREPITPTNVDLTNEQANVMYNFLADAPEWLTNLIIYVWKHEHNVSLDALQQVILEQANISIEFLGILENPRVRNDQLILNQVAFANNQEIVQWLNIMHILHVPTAIAIVMQSHKLTNQEQCRALRLAAVLGQFDHVFRIIEECFNNMFYDVPIWPVAQAPVPIRPVAQAPAPIRPVAQAPAPIRPVAQAPAPMGLRLGAYNLADYMGHDGDLSHDMIAALNLRDVSVARMPFENICEAREARKEDGDCAICFELTTEPDIESGTLAEVTDLKCKHKFHYKCLQKHYNSTTGMALCPICRGPIAPKDAMDLP